MINSKSIDRNTQLATVAGWGATSVIKKNDRSTTIVAKCNFALDGVVARLNRNVVSASPSGMLTDMLQASAPQLRQPDTSPSKGYSDGAVQSPAPASSAIPKGLDGAAALAYWVAKMQQVASDTSDQQLVDSMERFKQSNKIQRKSFEERADEAQKKEETAAVVSKVMGCAGKILGGLLVAASVVSAVFTGGTSLVLAGVGLALMAADGITEAITGESLTGRLLSPLIDSVFSPLVEKFAGVISGVLKKFGVSDDISRYIGAALGAMMAVMAVIAIAVVAKSSAASNVVSKLTGPLMRSLTKVAPQMLKSMASKSTALISSMASRVTQLANSASGMATTGTKNLLSKIGVNSFDPKVFSLYAQMAAVGTGTLRGAGDAGTSAWLGMNEEQLSKIQAEMLKLLTSMPQLDRIMDTAVKEWQNQQTRVTNLQKSSSDVMEIDQQTSAFVLRNARRMAV